MRFSKLTFRLSITILIAAGCSCTVPRQNAAVPERNASDTISATTPKPSDRNVPHQGIDIVEKKRFIALADLEGEKRREGPVRFKKSSEIIMPGDALELALYEKLPISQEKRIELKRVDDEGTIFIYPLGTINLAGMDLSEARTEIERRMVAYIVSPFCEITIAKRAYEPRIFVFGEAIRLGAFPLHDGDRLLDALSQAGGPSPKAYTASIKLVRLYGDSVGVMSIDLMDIVKRGRLESNLLLQDQDIVYIPTNLLSSTTEVLSKLGSVLPWYYFIRNF